MEKSHYGQVRVAYFFQWFTHSWTPTLKAGYPLFSVLPLLPQTRLLLQLPFFIFHLWLFPFFADFPPPNHPLIIPSLLLYNLFKLAPFCVFLHPYTSKHHFSNLPHPQLSHTTLRSPQSTSPQAPLSTRQTLFTYSYSISLPHHFRGPPYITNRPGQRER